MSQAERCQEHFIHEEAVLKAREHLLPDEVSQEAARFFTVMGNETRFRILWALDQQELCVCDIASLLGMTDSAISHQLAVLRDAKLVKSRRDGKVVYYSLDDEHVHIMLKGAAEHAQE